MDRAKPFDIPKREVWEAYKRVRANQGTAGVDDQSIADFEADLTNNLYKLWNRLSSGSYHPPPVRRVEIPKGEGGTRPLGIPTVADRIAQTVVKRYLEPLVEPCFYPDSYGYRPGKSALDAVGEARQRCWRYAWVLDLDIQNFFDRIDINLLIGPPPSAPLTLTIWTAKCSSRPSNRRAGCNPCLRSTAGSHCRQIDCNDCIPTR